MRHQKLHLIGQDAPQIREALGDTGVSLVDAATMQAELLMPFDCPPSPLQGKCANGAYGADANPCAIAGSAAQDVSAKAPSTTSLAHAPTAGEDERERIVLALQTCHGHQGKAALMLHISRSTLFRKMRKLGIR